MQEGMRAVGPEEIQQVFSQNIIVRFNNISIRSLCITSLNLEKALTDAQYFNGSENFENQQFIFETIKRNLKKLNNSSAFEIVSHFLERRKTVE